MHKRGQEEDFVRYVDEHQLEEKGHGLLFVLGIFTFIAAMIMGSTVYTGFSISNEFAPYVGWGAIILFLSSLIVLWIDLRK